MRRTLRVMLGATLALALAAGVIGGWGQSASADRPSLQGLQVQINQMNARVNQLEGQVDALAPVLGMFDRDGSFLGIPVGDGVFNLDLGVTIARDTLLMLGRSDPDMYFELPDCQGQAYVLSERNVKNAMIGPYFPDGVSPVLFVVGEGLSSSVPVQSRVLSNPPNPCEDAGPGNRDVFPANEYTGGLSFSLPVSEPLWVDVAPPAP